VIAFGTFVAEEEAWRRYTEPGIARVAEPDSAILAYASVTSLPRSLNIILDAAARHDDLEALVLMHPHTELTDPGMCARVREVLQDPAVGVAGAAGARGGKGLAWWEGDVSAAPGTLRYEGYGGGGEFPGFGWAGPSAPLGEVDVVDGSLMVLSPWTVRSVRFDEGLRVGYGFDTDYCRQVRGAGRKVVTADLRAVFHHSLELVEDLDLWIEGHQQVARKWDDGGLDEAGWRARARRAEAEREAARATAFSRQLAADVRVLALEKAMEEATDTVSWRLTEPLRRLNKARRDRRARRARSGLEAAPAPDPAAVQDESQPSPQRLQAVHRARAKRD
jgi:hypothetical protein